MEEATGATSTYGPAPPARRVSITSARRHRGKKDRQNFGRLHVGEKLAEVLPVVHGAAPSRASKSPSFTLTPL